MELERRATKICFQAWQDFLPAQRVKKEVAKADEVSKQQFSINLKIFYNYDDES